MHEAIQDLTWLRLTAAVCFTVLLQAVDEDSAAWKAGIRSEQLITQIDDIVSLPALIAGLVSFISTVIQAKGRDCSVNTLLP